MKFSAVTVLLSVVVLFLVIEEAYPTTQCNLYNLAIKGAYPCALQWWRAKDWSKSITFSPNATGIITNSMIQFGLDPADVGRSLGNAMLPDTSDTNVFSKIIESVLVVEPYLMYMVADVMEGFDLTREELAILNLPGLLAERGNLGTLYNNYFSISCKEDPVEPFLKCVDDWMANNCDDEDEPEVVSRLLTGLKGAYCTDEKTLKPDVKKSMDDDLGTVFAPVAKQFGVIKDPQSSFVFNLSRDSIFYNQAKLQEITQAMSSCVSKLQEELNSTIDFNSFETSSAGAGVVVDKFMEVYAEYMECMMKAGEKVGIFDGKYQKMLDHASQVYPEYLFDYDKFANSAAVSVVAAAVLLVTLFISMFM